MYPTVGIYCACAHVCPRETCYFPQASSPILIAGITSMCPEFQISAAATWISSPTCGSVCGNCVLDDALGLSSQPLQLNIYKSELNVYYRPALIAYHLPRRQPSLAIQPPKPVSWIKPHPRVLAYVLGFPSCLSWMPRTFFHFSSSLLDTPALWQPAYPALQSGNSPTISYAEGVPPGLKSFRGSSMPSR